MSNQYTESRSLMIDARSLANACVPAGTSTTGACAAQPTATTPRYPRRIGSTALSASPGGNVALVFLAHSLRSSSIASGSRQDDRATNGGIAGRATWAYDLRMDLRAEVEIGAPAAAAWRILGECWEHIGLGGAPSPSA